MAKGAIAKKEILEKLKNTFEDSFMQDDKILRIPWTEGGEPLEIKVTLTAAKDIIGGGASGDFDWSDPPKSDTVEVTSAAAAPTQEEKENVANLLKQLGL